MTVQRVRKAGASVQQGHLANMVRWYKQGNLPPMDEDWSETKSLPVNLNVAIEAASTYEDLGNLSKLVMIELSAGNVTPAQATAFKGLILEARQALSRAEEKEPDDVEDTLVPVSEEACELARQFEGILDEDVRKTIITYVGDAYRDDLKNNPNFDSAKQ